MSKFKGILGALAGAVTLIVLSTTPVAAWKTNQSASAYCSESNRAVISWTFTNTEPQKQNLSMDVVATDLNSGKSSAKVTATPGQTVSGTIVPGDKNVGEGNIKFELTWTDGRHGVDTRKASYDATNCVDEPKQTQVCRDGKVVTIPEDERKPSDTDAPCVLAEEDTPKVLPNTGIGGVLSGVFGAGAIGASLKSWLESRNMLKTGALRKEQ
jgi:hypothetical protein